MLSLSKYSPWSSPPETSSPVTFRHIDCWSTLMCMRLLRWRASCRNSLWIFQGLPQKKKTPKLWEPRTESTYSREKIYSHAHKHCHWRFVLNYSHADTLDPFPEISLDIPIFRDFSPCGCNALINDFIFCLQSCKPLGRSVIIQLHIHVIQALSQWNVVFINNYMEYNHSSFIFNYQFINTPRQYRYLVNKKR